MKCGYCSKQMIYSVDYKTAKETYLCSCGGRYEDGVFYNIYNVDKYIVMKQKYFITVDTDDPKAPIYSLSRRIDKNESFTVEILLTRRITDEAQLMKELKLLDEIFSAEVFAPPAFMKAFISSLGGKPELAREGGI